MSYKRDMPLWIPAITLLLALASDRSQSKRTCKLVPPDFRWLTVQDSATDMVLNGMDYDLVDWLIDLAQSAGVAPLLDNRALKQLEHDLRYVRGARVIVNPETGFWSVQHGRWLIETEPWCIQCLEHVPIQPQSTGEQLVLYRRESEQRRQREEMVPRTAKRLFAELWLPARDLSPDILGLNYNIVQVCVWELA